MLGCAIANTSPLYTRTRVSSAVQQRICVLQGASILRHERGHSKRLRCAKVPNSAQTGGSLRWECAPQLKSMDALPLRKAAAIIWKLQSSATEFGVGGELRESRA